MKLKTKGKQVNYLRKEFKFRQDGKEYLLVIQCTPKKLEEAADSAVFGRGVNIKSSELFDITTFRDSHK